MTIKKEFQEKMTIKKEFQKIKTKHDEQVELIRLQIKAAMTKTMDDFTENTGFVIKKIDIDIISHYSNKGWDLSLITNIGIKTDIQEG